MGKAMRLVDRIGRRIKLHDLHVLMTVVQAGSMSKAAAMLNTGQSAISRSVAELEYALGVRLLERGSQGIAPTEYGRALLDGGTAAFDDLKQAVKNIEFLTDPTVGDVGVGCNPFLAASFVSAIIGRMSLDNPGITCRLETGYVEQLDRQLENRNVDLLITRPTRSIAGEKVNYEILFEDSYSFAVGAGHRWAKRRKIGLSELMDQSWVLPTPGSSTGIVAMNAFRKIGRGYPAKTVIVDLFAVRISLLLTGQFISIFPDSVLRFSPIGANLKVLKTSLTLGRMSVGIVTLKNRAIRPPVQTFIDTCREVARRADKNAT